jgi:hypothetical protein
MSELQIFIGALLVSVALLKRCRRRSPWSRSASSGFGSTAGVER